MSMWPLQAPLDPLPQGMDIPLPTDGATPVGCAEVAGDAYLYLVEHRDRKTGGHPAAAVAKFKTFSHEPIFL